MAKLIHLDDKFLTVFDHILSGGLTLGPALSRNVNLKRGTLSVWVPDYDSSLNELNLSNVDEDIFFPASVDRRRSFIELLQRQVTFMSSAVIMVETSHSESQVKNKAEQISWLSLPTQLNFQTNSIVACLERIRVREENIEMLMKETSGYPSVAAISANVPATLVEGLVSHLSHEEEKQLLNSVYLIAVGVFDESSTMVWKEATHAERQALD